MSEISESSGDIAFFRGEGQIKEAEGDEMLLAEAITTECLR